ncbi:hypothetical protein ADL27_34915, partial [Streptomyces sp. NRRL F-6602]
MADTPSHQAPASPDASAHRRVLEGAFDSAELEWESPRPGHYVVKLPGSRKLWTTVSFILGGHSLSVNAFVVRRPDENHEAVHRWLLEKNLKLYGVGYAVGIKNV